MRLKGTLKMAEKKKQPGYIKTENTILMVFIAVTIGFVGGIVFGVYKSGTIAPQGSGMPPIANNAPDNTAEIETLKQRTLSNPNDVDSWIQIGHLYFDSNQVKDAINAYETALKIKPNNPDVLTDLGVMYRRAKNPKEAIAKFDQAISIDPTHQVSRFNKGVVLMHDLNDAKGAVDAWQQLIELNPDAKAPNGQLVKDLLSQFKTQGPK
jgi:cytochrome c-type biogenesis protein CcmH/NrfG